MQVELILVNKGLPGGDAQGSNVEAGEEAHGEAAQGAIGVAESGKDIEVTGLAVVISR